MEPEAPWFEPEMQARYEERRLAREIEQAHVEAHAEDLRRTNDMAAEHRKQEEERRAAEEQQRRELAAQKEKEFHRLLTQKPHEEAIRIVQEQLELGLAVKSIPEPERSRRIDAVASELIRRWEGARDKPAPRVPLDTVEAGVRDATLRS